MTMIELENKILKFDLNNGKLILDKLAYLCLIDGYDIIILTSPKQEKVGGILRYGNADIQFLIFPEFQNKHYLSNFFKSGVMQKIWNNNQEISLDVNLIDSIDEYNMKMHLVELTGYKLKNRKQLQEHLINL